MSDDVRTVLDALSAEQRDILGHALGLNYRPRQHRNYYCAELSQGTPPAPIDDLVRRGLLEPRRTINEGRDCYYSATSAGTEVAKLAFPPPKPLSRSQARYQRFLRLSGVYPDLTFRQFLTTYEREGGHAAPETERVSA